MKKKQPPIVVVILEHARSTGRTWELELETPNDSLEQDHASVRDLVSRAVRTLTSALRVTPTVGRHWNLDLGDLAALADAVGVPIIERRPARPARKRAAKKKAAKKPARRSR